MKRSLVLIAFATVIAATDGSAVAAASSLSLVGDMPDTTSLHTTPLAA